MFIKKRNKTEMDTRDILLQTAAKLFAEHGFEAVSTRMLAKESGVNMAMIAYYFGSKEKLFEAIIESRVPQMTEILRGLLESDLEPFDKLNALVEAYIERVFSFQSFTKLIYRELSLEQRPDHSRLILDAIMINWDIAYQIIEEGQQKGVFKKDIDTVMTMSSVFSSIIQPINTPCILARALDKADCKAIFEDDTKKRIKEHLKQMLRSHLEVVISNK